MMWNNACPLWNSGAWGAWGWVGMLLNVLLWVGMLVGLISLVVWLVRRTGQGSFGNPFLGAQNMSQQNARAQDATEIAKARYARGEISREEYMNLREDLR